MRYIFGEWKNNARVKQCSKILREFKGMLVDRQVTERVVNKSVGELGKALVAHVHSKSKDYKDVDACKWGIWERLVREYADELEGTTPPKSWGKAAPSAGTMSGDGKAAPPAGTMSVLRKDGTTDNVAQLEKLGFKSGMTIKAKNDHVKEYGTGNFKIEAITKKGVTIIDQNAPWALP